MTPAHCEQPLAAVASFSAQDANMCSFYRIHSGMNTFPKGIIHKDLYENLVLMKSVAALESSFLLWNYDSTMKIFLLFYTIIVHSGGKIQSSSPAWYGDPLILLKSYP